MQTHFAVIINFKNKQTNKKKTKKQTSQMPSELKPLVLVLVSLCTDVSANIPPSLVAVDVLFL